MSLKKITEDDLAGRGVRGQADVPGLTAAEMQEKVEEIVRSVVIPAMNENSEKIEENFATKEELGEVVLASGAVTSVFGRAGNVGAKAGDYTAQMVGAAEKNHAAQHKTGGEDALAPADIGAANESHAHGEITSAGAIGITKGLLVVTGASGVLTTENKAASGLMLKPKTVALSGDVNVALADETEYTFTAVTALNLTVNAVSCHGFVTFGTGVHAVSITGFTKTAGDDPTAAGAGEVWEFDCLGGYIIWKNWSAV